MSERGLPIADGAPACPFVAFEDDRDERASEPDHRHRCYADVRPAPRALAHQAAYCLSSAFPVCPTFQDWAKREAARARDAAASAAAERATRPAAKPPRPLPADEDGVPGSMPLAAATPPAATDAAASVAADSSGPDPHDADMAVDPAEASTLDDEPREHDDDAEDDLHDEGGPRRNPPREWSAPPPWLASAEASRTGPTEPPDFLSGRSDPGRGLAGSAADLLAGGSPPRSSSSRLGPSTDLPELVDEEPDFEARDLPRPAVPRPPAAAPRRPRAYDQHLGGPTTGPDWERPRRYEAYPTIKTRMSLPSVPRLAGMAAAVALAAVALFFLPAFLGLGANETPGASPTRSPSPSRSIAPTPTPAPTPLTYIIKKGDTLSKIAVANGVTTEELLAANPDIKDPNKIIVGQAIIIPVPSAPPEVGGGSASPSGSAAP